MSSEDLSSTPELSNQEASALEGVASVVEYLELQLTQQLGKIALVGATEETQVLVDRINDAAERISNVSALILRTVEATPVYEPWLQVDTEAEHTEYDLEPEPETNAELEELGEDLYDVLEFLRLLPLTEPLFIGKIVKAKTDGERLARQDYLRFVGKLNALCKSGFLVRIEGSSYGPGSRFIAETEANAPEAAVAVDETSIIEPVEHEQEPIQPQADSKPNSKTAAKDSKKQEPTTLSLQNMPELDIEFFKYIATLEQSFRLEELRKVEPLSLLSKEDYDDFKHRFAQFREDLIQALAAEGVTARWNITGQTRGTRYELKVKSGIRKFRALITDSPKDMTEDVEVVIDRHVVVPKATYADLLEQEPEHEVFLKSLIERVQATGVEDSVQRNKLSDVIKNLLVISVDDAKSVVDLLVKKEMLFVLGTKQGYRLYSFSKPEARVRAPRTKAAREAKDLESHREFDKTVLEDVYNQLIKNTHLQQGVQLKDLVTNRGLQNIEEEDYRRAVRRLESRGLVRIDASRTIPRRSGHSKRIQATVVFFPSQGLKDIWRNNRTALFTRFESED